nr:hypothetical protein [Tanacetum cinerariifolium]
MVAILTKSEASEGFDQIIDFQNGSYIKYALTVNPHIYVSCIKQFWNTVTVKQSNDATRLQALVDRKKVVISEAVIKDALCLADAEGVDCLPNEEIFTRLARMGSAMASAVIWLSTGRKFNFSKYIFDSLVRNVDSSSNFYMYLRFIQLIIQNQLGKGFSGVETPLFEGMLVAGENVEKDITEERVQDNDDKVAQDLEIIKLKTRVKKLEKANKVKALKLRRLRKVGTSQRVDTSDDTIMRDEEEKKVEEVKDITGDAQVEGRQAEIQAEIYQIDMDHPSKVLSMHEDETEV